MPLKDYVEIEKNTNNIEWVLRINIARVNSEEQQMLKSACWDINVLYTDKLWSPVSL